MLIGWDRGHFFSIFLRTRAKLLIPDWPSAKITRIWLAKRESAPFAFCRSVEMKNGFELLNTGIASKFDLQPRWLVKMVWKSDDCLKRNSKRWTHMCYGKQQIVICFKTTENLGATWSIIFQREKASLVRWIKFTWVLIEFQVCLLMD